MFVFSSLYFNIFGLGVVVSTAALTGLVMYAKYRNCDPFTAGWVSATDQVCYRDNHCIVIRPTKLNVYPETPDMNDYCIALHEPIKKAYILQYAKFNDQTFATVIPTNLISE